MPFPPAPTLWKGLFSGERGGHAFGAPVPTSPQQRVWLRPVTCFPGCLGSRCLGCVPCTPDPDVTGSGRLIYGRRAPLRTPPGPPHHASRPDPKGRACCPLVCGCRLRGLRLACPRVSACRGGTRTQLPPFLTSARPAVSAEPPSLSDTPGSQCVSDRGDLSSDPRRASLSLNPATPKGHRGHIPRLAETSSCLGFACLPARLLARQEVLASTYVRGVRLFLLFSFSFFGIIFLKKHSLTAEMRSGKCVLGGILWPCKPRGRPTPTRRAGPGWQPDELTCHRTGCPLGLFRPQHHGRGGGGCILSPDGWRPLS